MFKRFPFYQQYDSMDCGPTCLRMIAKFYGKSYNLENLREKTSISREGVSMLGISQAAEEIGFRTLGGRLSLEKLIELAPLPCILHWDQNHFVVLYDIKQKRKGLFGKKENIFYISDPGKNLLEYSEAEFLTHWGSTQIEHEPHGIALMLEPTPKFYELQDESQNKLGFKLLFSYVLKYKKLLVQLVLSLVIGSILQLIFPFLTQSIVDVGVNNQNLNFIYLVLAAQLMLFIGRTSVEFIRSWILLYISTRINISILSDFFIKLMKLPLAFFDIKMQGDIMQRINDHQRIEHFLTGATLNTLFSFINLIVFSIVLAMYNTTIFFVFLVGSILYMLWIMLFLKRRRVLDFKRFDVASKESNIVIELINGMQEIKMNNCETQKRWKWERMQAKQFRLSFKQLALSQYQQAGAVFINEGKNIFITFLAAKAVIDGHITLGAMLAIEYIIGQLNSPVEQLIGFMQTAQDAKISLERLNEIHAKEDEEPQDKPKLGILPASKSFNLKNVSFQYPGAGNDPVLKDVTLTIPQGKITAIVGASGSGKTTLLKLLLKFYNPSQGEIRLGETQLDNISHRLWRSKCGVVMQDGFIFSDTIANNIAVDTEYPDVENLINATNTANIKEFVESLPLTYNTKIGAEGNGISQGQRQRILIARAVYKNPDFIFFDEATNALDANNEKVIMENLDEFFKGRTVVVVAHRLSTVKNADQIVVLDKGFVTEYGTHEQLTALKGDYYKLVKNQLELGN